MVAPYEGGMCCQVIPCPITNNAYNTQIILFRVFLQFMTQVGKSMVCIRAYFRLITKYARYAKISLNIYKF